MRIGEFLVKSEFRKFKNPVSNKTFQYNDLYELTAARGTYEDESAPYGEVNHYEQTFTYDTIGNMTEKTSRNWKDAGQVSRRLNYEFSYTYDPAHPHRATQIGDYEYTYDANGNTTEITRAADAEEEQGEDPDDWTSPTDDDTHGSAPYNFTDVDPDGHSTECDLKRYEWDEENRLTDAYTGGLHTIFAYDAGGERTVKFSENGETVYVDKMYQLQVNHDPVTVTKHIFVGTTRVASKVGKEGAFAESELNSIYYYHGDHLGSSNFVTDCEGEEYEHMEYTPYGESWIDEGRDTLDKINYLFTSKELDRETGLYYFGARYLDPRTSRWLSSDPVMDGVNWYGYCGNNPVMYVDPAGLYKVESGDTLWDISQRYHTTVDAIMKLNKGNIEKAAEIDVGQHIVLPGEVNAYKDVEDYHRVYAGRENNQDIIPQVIHKEDLDKVTKGCAFDDVNKKYWSYNPGNKHMAGDIKALRDADNKQYTDIDIINPFEKAKLNRIPISNNPGGGNAIKLHQLDYKGEETGIVLYAGHLASFNSSLNNGQIITRGEKVAIMGATGTLISPPGFIHAHVEILLNGQRVFEGGGLKLWLK